MNDPSPAHGSAAAYVLGALAADERAAFEDHLAECPECRQTVGELSGLPALLSRVDPAELEEPPPAPDTLLPRLLAEVRRSGRRRRLATWGAAAAAAILAIALGGTLVVRDHQPTGLRMHPVVAGAPIHATAALSSESWGTRIRLRCSYEGYPQSKSEETYRLVVTNARGQKRTVSTWTAVPNKISTITGSVEWARTGISDVTVEEADGTTVLALQLT